MYPRKVNLFKPWAAAMIDGATVDKPDYGKKTMRSSKSTQHRKRRRRRKKKRNNGSKD